MVAVVTPVDRFLQAVNHSFDWFVASVPVGPVLFSALSEQCPRLPSSPRGYGVSRIGFENKIVDGSVEIAIAVLGYTAGRPADSLLWSLSLATRVCLLHDNSVPVVDEYLVLTFVLTIQLPAPFTPPQALSGLTHKS